jgi:beta-phosphoglucomutase-like phosphatase (HAD superfamily)
LGALRGVLFDWDGTLVDSAGASYRCYKGVFESFGIPFAGPDFERTYATDWHHTYREMGLREESWDEADRRWFGFYESEETLLLPGARRGLDRLFCLGLRVGVVTGGNRSRVLAEMKRLEILHHFETVVCRDDVPHLSPIRRRCSSGSRTLDLNQRTRFTSETVPRIS